MRVKDLIFRMEKCGSISFDSAEERDDIVKLAQGAMMGQPAMPMDGAMMDPSMMATQQQGAPPIAPQMDPAMMAQQQMPPAAPMSAEEIMVGEGITNSDIDSLVKAINILSALKQKYDTMKREQLDSLKPPQEQAEM